MHSPMKTRILLSLSVAFLTLISLTLFSQVVAVGHISAEVVETVSASSNVTTDFQLGSNPQGDISHPESIKLGSIQISSGIGVACNLTLKAAELRDVQGNDFQAEPVASLKGQTVSQIAGPQTLELAALAKPDNNQQAGMYQGSYTLVFAYN